MSEQERIEPRVIEDEMREAYLSYAMSVIVGRALPDVRDGLKPVHRRILYAMSQMGIRHNQAHKKCARIVGDVLGQYHPHGDQAVYDSLVRMVQEFSLRYPLIDGQGNFGSVDGHGAAAYRYTEARLSKVAQELLQDLDKETVDWVDTFDNTQQEPTVLPTTLPNLLLNGSAGIAVGMATNMPPHNTTETCTALKAYLENPDITLQELQEILPGPDFPTGGIICGRAGILQAYAHGRGKIILRAKLHHEQRGERNRIIVTEIPYQVVKADLIRQIADLVRDKRLEGIADIRDESDRQGMRIVIVLKRDASPDILENQLYKYTRLQVTFGIINLALVNGEPRVLTLIELFHHFLTHRKDVITRRTVFELQKAEDRAHILEGLIKALDHIDRVIELIKKQRDAEQARATLMATYELSEPQAKAILDMRLQRLTGLEQETLRNEYSELQEKIADLKDILENPTRVKNIITGELDKITETYGDQRKTAIIDADVDIDMEDLIDPEDMVVTISHKGYVKRLSIDTYQAQRRGGVGIIGATTKDDDFVEHLFVANTHHYLLFFTNLGKVYWKKVYHIPETSRTARGNAVVNLLNLSREEKISAVIPVEEFNEDEYLVFATSNGTIKKTSLKSYSRPRQGGINAINLVDNDDLVRVIRTRGGQNILVTTANGQAIHFNEEHVRPMGRVSTGVRAIKLKSGDYVVGLAAARPEATVLTVTENGYGKRTPIAEYPLQGRGGMGVRNIVASPRNGPVVSTRVVNESDDILLISQNGIIIRTSVREISQIGRNTQGVRVMKLRPGDQLSSIAKVISDQ